MKKLLNIKGYRLCLFKLSLKMKLTVLLTIVSLFQIQANSYSQGKKISLDISNAPLETIIQEIEAASEFKFLINRNDVDLNRKVTIKVENKKISIILSELFQNTEVDYEILNKQIILRRKKIKVIPSIRDQGSNLPIKTGQFQVSGVINDEDGNPLPGANILEKGTINGVQSDFDGKFTLTVGNSNAVLLISYVGFITKEIPINGQLEFTVILSESASRLDEVVVTALGISREKKGLGYAVQELKGDDINEARETNFVNSLSGKIAGVSISTAGGVGATSRIVIRGENSLNFGGNDPLYVVDGVPTGNSGTSNSTSADYGNSAAEINPADIESVTVLKGAAAAALYGSRAANGVIVITTKSGKRNTGLGVSVTTGTTLESLLRFPKFQNQFGQGRDGNYEGSNFGASFSIYPDGIRDGYDESWGPRLNVGTLERQFHSPTLGGMRGGDVSNPNRGEVIPTPWIAYPNNMRDFFQTGTTFFNNVAISGGNDKGTFRLSYTGLDQKGIIPNNDLKRNTIAIKSTYKLSDKFNVDATVNYTNSTSTNRPETGYDRTSIMYMFNWSVRNLDINSLRDYWQRGFEGTRQFQYNYGENHNNPFFYQYENTKGQDKKRIFGKISLTYDFTDHFSIMLRGGTDYFNDFRPQKWAVSTVGAENGRYQEISLFNEERNYDFLLTYKNKIGEDFNYNLSGGGNQLRLEGKHSAVLAPELSEPGFYTFANSAASLIANSWSFKKSLNSLYAFAYLDYKSTYFLDITARNDWSSTLPTENNSYFYPSLSFSALLNNTFTMPDWVSLAKIRLGAAQVGNDTGVATLIDVYAFQQPWGNLLTMASGSNLSKFNVKPESITTYEIGTDLRFFQDRLNLDFTYYDTRSKNHIMGIPLPASTSYNSRVINAGEIQNKGMEIMLNATPIISEDGFQWKLTLNWSKNEGKVKELAQGITSITQSAPGEDASIQARIGERMGAIWGPGYRRVESGPLEGEIIIGASGMAQITSEDIYLGNFNPDWMGSINNLFTYKNVSLSGLVDIKWGGEFISRFYNKGVGAGQLIESLEGRSARPVGQEYDDPYFIPGAALVDGTYVQNSTSTDGTYSEGVYGTDVRNFFKGQLDHISEAQLIDATYIKVRELKLGYTFPNDIFNGYFKDVSVSLVGRNLFLWTPKSNVHFDPEVAVATGGNGLIPGFENMSLPSTKSIGFNLNLKF
ncbi:SusC/RagA family TonB-linked outer membrane protein [Arenibacter sp. S6351L]|uniref:SusC/RagA family TonB-linked outer membrane protein n=1 Tax=Arenibacter sp. S6351L TaxID=2926407 RepID=UPI001FF6CAA6|nr:SusC/RagA family TonB-linked outer membrane protein [Arenibacter sp. S6351L]MCK0136809.1 SusC/RagA family TonB-linked outer membrane protein [Arenibacter sp. S6351L]